LTVLKKTVAALWLLVCLSAPAVAGERKDLQVFKDISNQVTRYTQFTVFDNIEADVTNGHVVLSGAVTMPYKKDDIERRVRNVERMLARSLATGFGEFDVKNELKTDAEVKDALEKVGG
jgi:hypothetical protein